MGGRGQEVGGRSQESGARRWEVGGGRYIGGGRRREGGLVVWWVDELGERDARLGELGVRG